jgi:hypothetical protein
MVMRRVFEFGKIDFTGSGRRQNLVSVCIELAETNKGLVFSASASVWNNKHTDIVAGGPMLDELNKWFGKSKEFAQIYRLWKLYNLNDMHAGCEHQRELGWEKSDNINAYDAHPSTPCPVCGYKFGTAWLYAPIPEEDLALIRELLK